MQNMEEYSIECCNYAQKGSSFLLWLQLTSNLRGYTKLSSHSNYNSQNVASQTWFDISKQFFSPTVCY